MEFEKQMEILKQGQDMKVEEVEKFLKNILHNCRNKYDSMTPEQPGFETARIKLNTMNNVMCSFLKEFKGQSVVDYEWV